EASQSAAPAAPALDFVDALPVHLEASLTQWHNQAVAGTIVGHSGPVLAAFGRRTAGHPFAEALLDDIVAIVRLAGARVEGIVDVLEHHFFVPQIFAGLAVELPQNTGLAGAEDVVLALVVNQDTLENFVEIERLPRRMIVIPDQLAGI